MTNSPVIQGKLDRQTDRQSSHRLVGLAVRPETVKHIASLVRRPPREWQTRGRYHRGRRPSSDDSLHSPTVISPSALDKPSIMKRCHRQRTCSHSSPRRSSTMVTLHDTRFVECRWWNDGWTVKDCRHLTVVGLRDTGPWVQFPLSTWIFFQTGSYQ